MQVSTKSETKAGTKQIRISVNTRMCQAIVIVARDGWNYDKYDHRSDNLTTYKRPVYHFKESDGLNVRISMNGPLRLTYDEWREFVRSVDDAWESVQ